MNGGAALERPTPHHQDAAIAEKCGDERGYQHDQEADDNRGRNGGECGFYEKHDQPEKWDTQVNYDDALGVFSRR